MPGAPSNLLLINSWFVQIPKPPGHGDPSHGDPPVKRRASSGRWCPPATASARPRPPCETRHGLAKVNVFVTKDFQGPRGSQLTSSYYGGQTILLWPLPFLVASHPRWMLSLISSKTILELSPLPDLTGKSGGTRFTVGHQPIFGRHMNICDIGSLRGTPKSISSYPFLPQRWTSKHSRLCLWAYASKVAMCCGVVPPKASRNKSKVVSECPYQTNKIKQS